MLGAIRSLINRLAPKQSADWSTPPLLPATKHQWPSEEEIITRGVIESGLTQGRISDVQFYLSAHRAGRLLFGQLRKFGTPITKDEKTAAGIRYRGVLSAEFVATLNEMGLSDPLEAAQYLAFPIQSRLGSLSYLKACEANGSQVVFMASNMAAGPCVRAASLDEQTLEPSPELITPFGDCPHPDQCGCNFRGTFDIEAMIEAELARGG